MQELTRKFTMSHLKMRPWTFRDRRTYLGRSVRAAECLAVFCLCLAKIWTSKCSRHPVEHGDKQYTHVSAWKHSTDKSVYQYLSLHRQWTDLTRQQSSANLEEFFSNRHLSAVGLFKPNALEQLVVRREAEHHIKYVYKGQPCKRWGDQKSQNWKTSFWYRRLCYFHSHSINYLPS